MLETCAVRKFSERQAEKCRGLKHGLGLALLMLSSPQITASPLFSSRNRKVKPDECVPRHTRGMCATCEEDAVGP